MLLESKANKPSMTQKLLQNLVTAAVLSLVLLMAGLIIWFFKKESGTSFQDILFYVGAAPIIIFALGQIGNFFGRGDHTVQLSRSVSNKSPGERGAQDILDIKSGLKSGINWFIAGLLVWLYSSFM